MEDHFARMEAKKRALLEEQHRLRQRVEIIRLERHRSMERELKELRRTNSVLRSEIEAWEKAPNNENEFQIGESPREATPPAENRPSQPKESATSPDKKANQNQSDSEGSPNRKDKSKNTNTPRHKTNRQPTALETIRPAVSESKEHQHSKNHHP